MKIKKNRTAELYLKIRVYNLKDDFQASWNLLKIDFFRFSAFGVSGSDLSFLAGDPKLSEARFRFSFPVSADWKVMGFA